MSDLTATNCGSCSSTFGGGCNSIIWIILLSCLFNNNNSNGCGFGLFGRSGCGCDGDCGNNYNNNNGCDWIIWIILLSCICGNNGRNC